MKKVLSFVLVLSMILGSFGMAFAAVPSDVVGKDYEDAVNVLMELGVVEGYKDGTYRPEKVVTRAEMATLIIKAMGLNDYAVGKSSFTDVKGHWAEPYVAYATSLGFISGFGDGTFRPDQTVTYDQAITMVVQALGYKGEYMVGGYPGAFVAQAKNLGMLDGIKSGVAGANRGDVATLLYNALPARFVRYDKNGLLDAVALSGDKDHTVYDTLLRRLGAQTYNGGNEFVVMGDEDSVINLRDYQGAYVTAYQNKDGEIIAVEEVKSVFLTGDFHKTKKEFEADGVTYDVKEKFVGVPVVVGKAENKKDIINYELEAYAFKNGEKIGSVDEVKDVLGKKDVTIAAKVSGKTIKEIYSVAEWEAKETLQWDGDLAEELADDDTLNGAKFVKNDDKEIDTDKFTLLGAKSLKDIEKDDVVTYYLNTDKEITKVEVSSDVVEGKVTKVKNGEDDNKKVQVEKATIDGKEYKVAIDKNNNSEVLVDVALGDEGKFFLNYAGKIAFKDVESEAKDYAIVLLAPGADGGYDKNDVKIKLLTADGKKTVYTIDEDTAKKLDTKLNDGKTFVEDTVVAYNVNKNGELDKLEACAGSNADRLSSKGYLDKVKVSDNVVVFKKNVNNKFTVGALSDVPTNKDLKNSTKYLNKKGDKVVAIVLGAGNSKDDSVYGVVVSFGEVKNDDDKTVYEVTMLVDGKEVNYLTTSLNVVPNADTKLYKLSFDGNEIDGLTVVNADENGSVDGLKDGNIDIGNGYENVSDDVVVYLINKDGDMELSKLSKINKKDTVWMYELDGSDDENGMDVIVYKEYVEPVKADNADKGDKVENADKGVEAEVNENEAEK